VKICLANSSDVRFIFKSWKQEGRRPRTPLSGDKEFSSYVFGETIKRTMELPNAMFRVVVHPNPDLRDTPLGWICTEEWGSKWLVVYFCYVSKAFRRMGLAGELVRHALGDSSREVVLVSCPKMWIKDYCKRKDHWWFDFDFGQQRLIYEIALDRS